MKKLFLLSVIVAFVALGAQAFASPPVAPPVEGFLIETDTTITVDGSMSESESYNNKYFENYGTTGYINRGTGTAGWQEGAEVAYSQTFKAINGKTVFVKSFEANTALDKANLIVDKRIGFDANTGLPLAEATHTEKVGLSVVSQGGTQGPNLGGLLSLCPWVTSGGGYPATNEGIAAGSTFKVTSLTNFQTLSSVTSTGNPDLKYTVDGSGGGVGDISAKFIVELFEGVKGTTWAGGTVPPPLESRTSYSEAASASGLWNFKKVMHYASTFPGLGTLNPFASVP